MVKKGKWAVTLVALALALASLRGPERPEAVQADAALELADSRPLVALTFDDGPSLETTPVLLDALAQRGVKATFFLIGEMLPGAETLVQRMEQEGHQIGTHSYDHVRLTGLSADKLRRQVDWTENYLRDLLGQESFLLRPPYGAVDGALERNAHSPLILWSVDPEDWKYRDADRITQHIIDNVQDGDIILLHDIHPTSVEAAARVVDALHEKGFLFVTVEELACQRGVELEPGKIYRSFPPG